MPGIDVSMYGAPQATPAPQNPLQMVGEFARANNAMNQARAFEREFRARDALGPMLKASIQPDGSVDTAKLFQMVAAHPDTGWKLPDLVEGFLRNQLTTAQIAKANLEIAGTHFSNMRDINSMMVTEAMEKAGGDAKQARIAPEDYIAGMSRCVSMGMCSAKQLAGIMSGMDIGPKPTPELEAQRDRSIFQRAFATANATGAANETINRTLGLANVPTTFIDPVTKREMTKPAWDVYQQMGNVGARGGPQIPTEAGMAPAPAPAGAPAGGAPGAPAAMPTPAGPPAAGAPAMPTAAPGAAGVIKSLSPVEAGRQDAFAKYSANLDTAATQAQDRMKTINQFREELSHFKPGAGISWMVQAARFAQALGAGNKIVDQIAGGDLGAIQAGGKQAIVNAVGDLRQRLLSTAGEGSAGRLALKEFETFIDKANPNLEMDPRAINKMLNFQEKLAADTIYEQQLLSRVRGAFYNQPGNPLPKGLTALEEWPAFYAGIRQKHGFLEAVK